MSAADGSSCQGCAAPAAGHESFISLPTPRGRSLAWEASNNLQDPLFRGPKTLISVWLGLNNILTAGELGNKSGMQYADRKVLEFRVALFFVSI